MDVYVEQNGLKWRYVEGCPITHISK